jgi:hypothetical protein
MSRRSDAIERFTVEAEASGLEVEVQQYPGGTRTAADAAVVHLLAELGRLPTPDNGLLFNWTGAEVGRIQVA